MLDLEWSGPNESLSTKLFPMFILELINIVSDSISIHKIFEKSVIWWGVLLLTYLHLMCRSECVLVWGISLVIIQDSNTIQQGFPIYTVSLAWHSIELRDQTLFMVTFGSIITKTCYASNHNFHLPLLPIPVSYFKVIVCNTNILNRPSRWQGN